MSEPTGNICECCGDELTDYESDLLDCGHYACNSCSYVSRDDDRKTERSCEKCMEKSP